jgi:streptomycin 6-kinase
VEEDAWLSVVPGIAERCAERWGLQLGEPLQGGSVGRVFACRGPQGQDLVLKLSPPLTSVEEEARALLHWGGKGSATVVDWSGPDSALLLERIRPGIYIMERDRSRTDDDLAVRAASDVLNSLHSVPPPAPGVFPSFEERLRWWLDYTARYGEPDAAGTAMLPKLERCALALHASAKRKTLLHGDFVAKNLLLGPDGRYVAVDPIPCIGDPCCDVGQFTSYHSPVATCIQRAHAIAEATGNDPGRAAQWAAIWMVYQACETWREDSDDVQAWATNDECQALLEACMRDQ